jgi:hypothetical protein
MTLILKASPWQLVFACIRSGLAIMFGIALFVLIPAPTNYVMLIPCCFVAVIGLVEEIYNRLEIANQAVTFRSLFKRWSVPFSEIKDWRIKGGNDRSLSLHIFTHEDREHCVPGLSSLGVRDPNKVAKTLANRLQNHRREK